MYALIVDNKPSVYPLSLNQWRKDHPSVSLPFRPSEAQLNEQGIYSVEYSAPPTYDHTVNRKETAQKQSDGTWKQAWIETPATTEEIALRTNEKINAVRIERNKKLADSDWTQLPDAQVEADAWASYRQALRDITEQDGFPWEIDWPFEP